MTYKEEMRDLFTVSEEYYLAHCISADFGMGKGIVIEFNKRFDMKRKLQSKYPDYVNEWHHNNWCGDCILEGRVLNLITKERYFHKPTYDSLKSALLVCWSECLHNDIKKIAMPVIGCGLDRLQWDKVSEIIKDVFKDADIEILVCYLPDV
jgi:O-acetyl-ADP-ribose deacetylase (regulator of RNase III)